MASSDFPNNLITNTYILHDYLEIAYIVCTGAVPTTIDKATNLQEVNSRERVLARLRNARQQFRQASILVVLDAEKLELITFYKKADIVKDQQAILAKFGNICKSNACKIERKNACRVVDLVKPESARVWRLFSEAVLASLTLQTPGGKRVMEIGASIYLVPEFEASFRDEAIRTHCETKYYLRKADLQIVTGGYLLLAIRDSSWPPMYALTDMIDAESLPWTLQSDSILYLVPTGQLARYKGGWIGKQDSPDIRAQQHQSYSREDINHRARWFDKVRQWLEARDNSHTLPSKDTLWCSVEIPVLESFEEDRTDHEAVSWKTVVWPADLTYVFLDDKEPILQNGIESAAFDPLIAAQTWFSKDLHDVRTTAGKDVTQNKGDASFVDGNLFDDDAHFGSPQQFMNAPAQTFHPNQMVYPTPPEAMNPQNTPGVSMDGAAQTPMSAYPAQPSIYQSSPLAMTTDLDAAHSHNSAISNFLQHNDDDLFEDEEDQKLAQPSFGDEPNWDFFDRDTTTPELKAGLNFDDLNVSPVLEKTPDAETNARLQPSQLELATREGLVQASPKDILTHSGEARLATQKAPVEAIYADISSLSEPFHAASTMPSKVKDFAVLERSGSPIPSLPPSVKRRRSSAYDVSQQPSDGHDHKYGPSGKYHFELKRPSVATRDVSATDQLRRRGSSSSVSSQSSLSHASSDEDGTLDRQAKLWTQYEPITTIDMQEASVDDGFSDPAYATQIDELLEIISLASGTEPFTGPPPPKQDPEGSIAPHKSPERWFMIAQILTEQLTQSSVFKSCDALQLPRNRVSPAFDVFVENTESGTNIANASLGDLATIQPASSNSKPTTRTLALEPDRIRLRQADGEISAELPIIKYWETVNLQPLSGPKNVQALCLHQEGSNYLQGCDSFMRRMKETYTSCNLGSHERLKAKGITDTGLLSWGLGPGKIGLSSLCRSIGKILATKSNVGCLVVYAVLPSGNLSHSIEICDAFLELFEALGHANHPPENDIVLQLVPHSFVVDANNLVVQPQKQYVDLALEVYNRTPCVEASPASVTANAVVLEKAVGRSLHFELSSKMSSPSLRSGHCCHLAYCISSDRRWLVASWSDSVGNMALTMPYCLVDEADGSHRPRLDALRHMCETSVRLMGRQKGQSWLAVAKVGIYDPDELQEWHYLCQQLNDEHKSISRIMILNVELQSRLSLHGSQGPIRQTIIAPQPAVNPLSTPATTPQAAITSPDQNISVTPTTSMAANAQTPPDVSTDPGAETDTYLSSPSNEAWATTLAFGLNQTHNFLEVRPAMASGFLFKRVPRQDNTSGLAILNVNLIGVPRRTGAAIAFTEREQMLQDVLVQYRGLHVLAVVRRCVDDTENCIPWHVATAFKGAKILEALM